MTIIDMHDMMYLNLFQRISQVRTKYVFIYNNVIFFCVPRSVVSKAIGQNAQNVRKVSETFRRRVKVIASPNGIEDIKNFIQSIVEPVEFKDVQVNETEVIVTAGNPMNKAVLMGRNKRRLFEMHKIIKNFFGKDYRIL